MNKNAFTLIELLAVIIILAIVALIATPIILDVVDDARKSAGLSESNMIYSSINNYCASIEMKKQMGTLGSEDVDCSSKTSFTTAEISKMVNLGKATVESNSYANGKLTNLVVISNKNRYVLCSNGSMALESDGCEVNKPDLTYKDNSGANSPELLDNMIPIKYDGSNWIYTTNEQINWYNYDKKEWANAVVLNDGVSKNVGDIITEDEIALWYVWIPRYTYTIFNGNNESVVEQEIKIKFESGTNSSGTVECVDAVSGNGDSSETCTDDTNGSIVNGTSTYTHPAFTFGTQELTGFWIGKFEVSGSTDEILIKPNVSSLIELNVSTYFTAIQNIGTTYKLNGDSHMMKNMEWGAVAYLSHSKYGTCTDGKCVEIGINNNSNYITGCGAKPGENESTNCNKYDTTTGMLASTTQNIYGVYDMSGGAFEYVMAFVVDDNGLFNAGNSGFTKAPDSKYYNSYTSAKSYTIYERGKLGDATKETLKTFGNKFCINESCNLYRDGWYANYTTFPIFSGTQINLLWMSRGCSHLDGWNNVAGLFAFGIAWGGQDAAVTTRAVLCKSE